MLRPTADIIQPHNTKLCKIFLSKFTDFSQLNDKNTRDKFLIQSYVLHDTSVLSTLYDGNTDTVHSDALSAYWKHLEAEHSPKQQRYVYSEQIIKCKLIVPDASESQLYNDEHASVNSSVQSVASSMPHVTAAQHSAAPVIDTIPMEQRTQSRNANTAQSSYDRVDAERSKSDYAELTAFTVQLTTQLEKAKSEYAALNTQYNALQAQNTQLQKQIQLLKQQSEADTKLLSDAGIKAAPRMPDTLPPAGMPGDKVSTVGGITGTSLGVIQVLIIAILAYLVGKFYR